MKTQHAGLLEGEGERSQSPKKEEHVEALNALIQVTPLLVSQAFRQKKHRKSLLLVLPSCWHIIIDQKEKEKEREREREENRFTNHTVDAWSLLIFPSWVILIFLEAFNLSHFSGSVCQSRTSVSVFTLLLLPNFCGTFSFLFFG
jgi:hypothetical protein